MTAARAARDTGIARGSSRAEAGTEVAGALCVPLVSRVRDVVSSEARVSDAAHDRADSLIISIPDV